MFADTVAQEVAAEFVKEKETDLFEDLNREGLVRIGQLVRLQTMEEFGKADVMRVVWGHEESIANFEEGWHFYEEFVRGLQCGPNPKVVLPRHCVRRMAHLIICEKVLNLLRSRYGLMDPRIREAMQVSA